MKVVRVVVGKGRTVAATEKGEEWLKDYYEIEMEVINEQEVVTAKEWAVNLISGWLQPATQPKQSIAEWAAQKIIGSTEEKASIPQTIPPFDPQEFIDHNWKRGRKREDGSYDEGSLLWGWDFAEGFSADAIQMLEKGSVPLNEYEVSLSVDGKFVQAQKRKKES